MKRTSIAMLAALAGMSSAHAADIYHGSTKDSPTYQAPVEAAIERNWSGIWVGAVGGLMFTNTDLSVDGHVPDGEGGSKSFNIIDIDGLGSQGLFAEIQAGFRYQLPSSRLVLGAFVGYNLSDAEWSTSVFDGAGKVTSQFDWGAVAGPSVGLALSKDTLVYVAGGFAWAKLDNVSVNGHDLGSNEGFNNPDLTGWFGEVGLEHKLGRVTNLKLAVRYTDLQKETLFSSREGNEPCYTDGKIDPDLLVGMVGLNFNLSGVTEVLN